MPAPQNVGKDGLNPRQERFVDEYLVTLNATKAAQAAGYSPKNEGAAASHGSRLLNDAKIKAAISRKKLALSEKIGVTRETIVEELRRCGFSNMADYMRSTKDGDPYLDFSKLTREQAAALSEVTVEDYTEGRGKNAREIKRVRFKLADKLSALEKLGRHLGMFDREGEKGSISVQNLSLTVIQMMQAAAAPKEKQLNDLQQ